MPIYYRGPRARITHELVEVWYPDYRSYPIRDLRGAWIESIRTTGITRLGAGSAGMAGAVAVTLALGRSAGWTAFDSPLALLAALAIFVASVVIARACWRARTGCQRLIGIYRSREVILYQDPDPQRFAQVARALTRAMERAGGTR